jgi:hypothetical protein
MAVSGRCLCGTVTFEGRGDPSWVVHCHCRNCQRASGAGFLTDVGFMSNHFDWTAEPPEIYNSSPGVERGFFVQIAGRRLASHDPTVARLACLRAFCMTRTG